MKTMTNKRIWLGILAITLVFGMMVIGCGGDDVNNNNNNNNNNSSKNPLTGTVTVSSNISFEIGREIMTLTADTSGLNGDSIYYFPQWQRDGVDISGQRQNTYVVTEADYGKTLKLKVTSSVLSGEQSGEIVVPNPKTLSLTLKWDTNAGKKDTYIIIERGQPRGSTSSSLWSNARAPSYGNLTTTATTITLRSWTEENFKMKTFHSTAGNDGFYFKKDNASGSDLFPFGEGSKSYTLTNATGAGGVLTGLVATEN